jgi:hypothetical protein
MRTSRRNLRAAACVGSFVVALLSASGSSHAAGNDKVAAEALFEQGRSLVAEGKFAEACPRFADSQRLDPSPGTLLNLASCYEKLGRTATAWATYREAASAANAAGRAEYVTSAQRHADSLAPRLAKLTATIAQPVDGLLVKRDGVEVTRAEWGVPIPIDSGSHTLDASAPGYKPWSSAVDVAKDGAQVSVTVPALEAAPVQAPPPAPVQPAPPPAPSPAPVAPADTSTGSSQRILGVVVGSAGILGLGASAVFAVVAKNKYNDSLQNCPTNPDVCNKTGVSQRDDALTFGNVASVALGVGAAALVGGAILWFTAPSAPSPAPSSASSGVRVGATPMVGLGVGGAVVQGTW